MRNASELTMKKKNRGEAVGPHVPGESEQKFKTNSGREAGLEWICSWRW